MRWLIRTVYKSAMFLWTGIRNVGNFLKLKFLAILIGIGILACVGLSIVLPRLFPATSLLTFYLGALILIGLLFGIIFLVAFDRLAETLSFIIQENLVLKNALNQNSLDLRKNSIMINQTNNEMNTLSREIQNNADATKALTEKLGGTASAAVRNLSGD